MGEQSPSESAARDTSTVGGGRAAYAKATQQVREAAAKKKQREQEEAMMRMAEDEDQVGLYARSSSGNIIRSSSGQGVTSSAGRQALENIRAGFGSDTKGYMKSRTTISSDDDAYAPEAERPKEPIIDQIQTAGLSAAAKKNLFGQDGDARARRKLMNRII